MSTLQPIKRAVRRKPTTHHWKPTGKPGRYRCALCRLVVWCPGCTKRYPSGARLRRCQQHKEAMP
jgi:hypothetical protein